MLEGETCDGHPRAMKDDARICFILDCCRCKITGKTQGGHNKVGHTHRKQRVQGIWDDLPGAKKDVTDMKARMEVNGYKVKVIENSPDILQDIKEEMNMMPVSSVSHLQLLYVSE